MTSEERFNKFWNEELMFHLGSEYAALTWMNTRQIYLHDNLPIIEWEIDPSKVEDAFCVFTNGVFV